MLPVHCLARGSPPELTLLPAWTASATSIPRSVPPTPLPPPPFAVIMINHFLCQIKRTKGFEKMFPLVDSETLFQICGQSRGCRSDLCWVQSGWFWRTPTHGSLRASSYNVRHRGRKNSLLTNDTLKLPAQELARVHQQLIGAFKNQIHALK